MLLLVNNLHEKHITELIWTFDSTHMLFVISTCVTNLYLCDNFSLELVWVIT